MVEVFAFLTTGFWMLMIFDCVRNDPERNSWIWLLIFLHFPGAVIYFLMRRLPQLNLPIPNYFKRWTLRQDLRTAEAGVKNIGKSHQYVVLGNVLTEMGNLDKAADAYQQALEKASDDTGALWGMASVAAKQKQFDCAKTSLRSLLQLDPDYKRGDASLLYGRVLFEMPDWEAAKSHLQQDIEYWSHPEASLMLATIQTQEGDVAASRDCLETMLAKLKACPTFYYRKHHHLARKAEKLLKAL